MSQKRHFCEFKQKATPKNAWSAFSIILHLSVIFCMTSSFEAINNRAKFQVNSISGSRDFRWGGTTRPNLLLT